MHRGSFAIACNLGADSRRRSGHREVVLAWDEPAVDAKTDANTASIRSRSCALPAQSR